MPDPAENPETQRPGTDRLSHQDRRRSTESDLPPARRKTTESDSSPRAGDPPQPVAAHSAARPSGEDVSGSTPSQRLIHQAMSSDALLVQRLVDGALPSHTAAAVERSLVDRPQAAADRAALADLHTLLGKAAKPLSADQHRLQMLSIVGRLPDRAPQPHAKIRVLDMAVACGLFILLLSTTVFMHSVVERSAMHLVGAVGCLVVGLAVMALASMLQRLSHTSLRRAVRTPISLGPTDILAYRAVGLALVIGGCYYLF
jgi:hypothetical protein